MRVFNMDKTTLLKHHALIVNKSSSLSSNQRATVLQRVAYGIERGHWTEEDVKAEISNLNEFIVKNVVDKINTAAHDSSTEE